MTSFAVKMMDKPTKIIVAQKSRQDYDCINKLILQNKSKNRLPEYPLDIVFGIIDYRFLNLKV